MRFGLEPARGSPAAALLHAAARVVVRHEFVRPSREGLPVAAQDEALQPSAAEAVVQLVAALSHAAPRVAALRLLVLVEVLPGAVQAGARPRGLLSAQEAEVAVSVRPSAAESVRRRARGAPPVQGAQPGQAQDAAVRQDGCHGLH